MSGVSPLTLNRLSLYLRCLRQLQELGVREISSPELAQRYQLSATQIRKDLAQFGEFGIRGVGYEVDELADHLNSLLGLDRKHAMVIVGMGNLGSALARYPASTPAPSMWSPASTPTRDSWAAGSAAWPWSRAELEQVGAAGAEIGVLAVPSGAAQQNYDALADAGIGGAELRPEPAAPRGAVEERGPEDQPRGAGVLDGKIGPPPGRKLLSVAARVSRRR